MCKISISLVSFSTTLTLFINSSSDFPISFLPWPITSTNRLGILNEKKGICNTSLGIVAIWLCYQPQLSAIGGSTGNHTNMSLVTSTNILSMLKKTRWNTILGGNLGSLVACTLTCYIHEKHYIFMYNGLDSYGFT